MRRTVTEVQMDECTNKLQFKRPENFKTYRKKQKTYRKYLLHSKKCKIIDINLKFIKKTKKHLNKEYNVHW